MTAPAQSEAERAYDLWTQDGMTAQKLATHLNADRPPDRHLTPEAAAGIARAELRRKRLAAGWR